MPARSIVILLLGLVIAVGTALSLKSRMGANRDASATTQVLVAAADIPAGQFIRADYHIGLADWPAANITESMLTTANVRPADFEGAVARRSIAKGEALTKNTLVKSTEGGFLSAVLEPGMRAISIAVDSTSGNAGFIFPGDHVDLILTHKIALTNSVERASETFVEDVRILAVDQRMDNPENKAVLAKTVTLEVTPKQAEEVNVAKDLGQISLSLRSLASMPAPTEESADAPTSFDDVLQSMPAQDLTPPANLTRDTDVSKAITPRDGVGTKVRVLRGGQEAQEIDFNAEGVPNVR